MRVYRSLGKHKDNKLAIQIAFEILKMKHVKQISPAKRWIPPSLSFESSSSDFQTCVISMRILPLERKSQVLTNLE
jgi:hypothetical protein